MLNSANKTPHLVILGAGLAGLATAHALQTAGNCRVTLLEKEDRPGGMARTLQVDGLSADLGPHRIYTTLPEVQKWFEDRAGRDLFSVRRLSRMYVNGRYLPYPPSPLHLLRAAGPLHMTKFMAGYLHAKTKHTNLEPASFAQAMEANFGHPLCEFLVYPYIRKMWKLNPDQISADAARTRATIGGLRALIRRAMPGGEKPGQESTLRNFHYIRGGIEGLAQGVAQEVTTAGGTVLCNARISRLEMTNDRIGTVHYDENGESKTITPDFVFSTIPVPELVQHLIAGGCEASDENASQLRYLHSILVYAVVKSAQVSEAQWLYFPQETPQINRAYESRNFDETLGGKGRSVICIEGTTLGADPESQMPDHEVARLYVERLASTGLFDITQVEQTRAVRLPNAYPLYESGYENHLASINQSLRAVPNLISLGRQGLFQHNNMDHTVYTGLRAAHCWRNDPNPVEAWHIREIPSFQSFRIVD